jgi:hypothetical protein
LVDKWLGYRQGTGVFARAFASVERLFRLDAGASEAAGS